MREERRLAKEQEELKLTQELNQIEEIKENFEEIEDNNRSSTLKKILFLSIIISLIIFSYIKFIGNKVIITKEYKIETNKIPEEMDGLKIVHFSDIHYGTTINKKELKKIVDKINKLKPDIVVFTGDIFDKNITIEDDDIKNISNELKRIEASQFKYAILGNEDNNKIEEILSKTHFILLNNETKEIYYKNNNPITITGINSEKPDYSILDNVSESTYNIVLTHKPDLSDDIIKYNSDLILSGHSLGGIIKLPFIKPLLLKEGAKKHYKEKEEINNKTLFISSGLGTSNIDARFNNQPSINFYRLFKIS